MVIRGGQVQAVWLGIKHCLLKMLLTILCWSCSVYLCRRRTVLDNNILLCLFWLALCKHSKVMLYKAAVMVVPCSMNSTKKTLFQIPDHSSHTNFAGKDLLELPWFWEMRMQPLFGLLFCFFSFKTDPYTCYDFVQKIFSLIMIVLEKD